MKYIFPSNYAESGCYLVAINASILPLVAGALEHFEERRCWHTDEEYEQAYNAFAELQACMMKCCIDQLVESNRQVYRLLDTTLNGRVYIADGDGTPEDPIVVYPEIPAAPWPVDSAVYPGMLMRVDRLEKMLNNFTNGAPSDEFADNRNPRQQLEDMKLAIEALGQLDDDMLEKLQAIALLLA